LTNGARKFDGGKPPITTGLLWRFPRAVKEVAKVSAVGAEKYEVTLPDDNCLRVENGFNRYADAIARHLVDRAIDGPMNNEKGGALPPEGRDVRHLAQLIWDGFTCLEIELIEEEKAKALSSEQASASGAETKGFLPPNGRGNDFVLDGIYYSAENYHPSVQTWVHDSPTTPLPHPPLNDSPAQLPLDLGHSSPKPDYSTWMGVKWVLSDSDGRFLVK
jgi:hypothetical protein